MEGELYFFSKNPVTPAEIEKMSKRSYVGRLYMASRPDRKSGYFLIGAVDMNSNSFEPGSDMGDGYNSVRCENVFLQRKSEPNYVSLIKVQGGMGEGDIKNLLGRMGKKVNAGLSEVAASKRGWEIVLEFAGNQRGAGMLSEDARRYIANRAEIDKTENYAVIGGNLKQLKNRRVVKSV